MSAGVSQGWSIAEHLSARRRGVRAEEVIDDVLQALTGLDDPAVIIGAPLLDLARQAARHIDQQSPDALPLHGVPFVVKDNLDVAGAPTTCAHPGFAYTPATDSLVVARLRAAGAIPVAKANLDQFATGLVGTRSPHGTPRNPLDAAIIPGGSSSGSAVAVARGLVPFSLGTDTAGSGRVPAALCGIVGVKPTIGRLPSLGMVPAVRRVDCPSVFARSVAEARLIADLAAGYEPGDAFSREPGPPAGAIRRIGVPRELPPSLVDPEVARCFFDETVPALVAAGLEVEYLDIDAFLEAGRLLYGGTFVAERTAAVGEFLDTHEALSDPTVRSIILGGARYTAVDAYRCEYELAALRARTAPVWQSLGALLLPTIPGVARLSDVAAEPVAVNSRLGTFTSFAGLLDLAAIAFPHGSRADGMPCGVQLIGPAWSDDALADVASVLLSEPTPVPSLSTMRRGECTIVVVGAHLQGMPLNHQLTHRGARLLAATTTAARYRLHALANTTPPKPGLQRVESGGAAIQVEVWSVPESGFATFVSEVPPPLGIGSVELDDGTWHKGFICEPIGLAGAVDVTAYGGWRAYMNARTA